MSTSSQNSRIPALLPLAALMACAAPKATPAVQPGSSIELEPGQMVMILQATTVKEAKALGLDPAPGDSVHRFAPPTPGMGGPSGICVIRAGRIIRFRITGQAL